MPEGPITEATAVHLDEAFGDEHERTYGHRGEPVELVSLNLFASGRLGTPGGGRPISARSTAGWPRPCWGVVIWRRGTG